MKITSLILKHNRVQVFIDDEYSFSCTQNFVVNNILFREKELSYEELETLKDQSKYSIVEFKLFEYAARNRYSRKELETKVNNYCKKKFNFSLDEKFFNNAFEKLISTHMFDNKYIIRKLSDELISKSKGKNFIRSKLISKGFNKSEVDEQLNSLEENDLKEKLHNMLKKKHDSLISGKQLDKFALKRKLSEFASRKGFSFKEINETLNDII